MQAVDFTRTVNVENGVDELDVQCKKLSACGFDFWLRSLRLSSGTGDLLQVDINAEPESSSEDYKLILDYRLTILAHDDSVQYGRDDVRRGPSIYVQYEPVEKEYSKRTDNERRPLRISWEKALDSGYVKKRNENGDSYECTIHLQLRVRDWLRAGREDYSQESPPRRDFSLLFGHQQQFYVDLQYLADQGSEYFRDLLESKRKGVRRAVIMNVDFSDMEIFLDAVCTHRKTVITNRNLDVVLRLAQEFCVDKTLRACEAYLVEVDTIHPIRKLEYAAEYGLGLLGETVVRRLTDTRPLAALDSLHEYMQMNDELLDQMHPEVLSSLNVFEGYVIM